MKGSQEACPGRSVRIAQTRSGLALISTVELTVFIACSFPEGLTTRIVLGGGQCAEQWPRKVQESCCVPDRGVKTGTRRQLTGRPKMAANLQRAGWRDMTVQFPSRWCGAHHSGRGASW